MTKLGRARQIELYFIVPSNWPAWTLSEWDAVREVVVEAIGWGRAQPLADDCLHHGPAVDPLNRECAL